MTRIPVLVIGGYLGAGKTTLLNALLENARGVRYAALVNDFGSVNLDAESIARSGTQTVELTNGCTCCTIGGDLILALKSLVEHERPPDRIAIEASGVADPAAVARLAACHPQLDVRGSVVVADAGTVRDRADDKYVGELVRRQLGAGNTLVLNKIDTIDRERLTEVRRWFAQTSPGVPVFESGKNEAFALEIAFDGDLPSIRREDDAGGGGSHAAFASTTYRCEHPIERARFLEAVGEMIPSVARAKGTVTFADEPAACYSFQLAGERWTLEPVPAPDANRKTLIVAIAPLEREAGLKAAFARLGSSR